MNKTSENEQKNENANDIKDSEQKIFMSKKDKERIMLVLFFFGSILYFNGYADVGSYLLLIGLAVGIFR